MIQKLLKIPRLITQWHTLLIITMLFLLTDSPQKLKLENIYDTLIILFYVSPRSPQLKEFSFSIKTHKKNQVQMQWTLAFKSGSCRLRFS